jgi:hypothetical protein
LRIDGSLQLAAGSVNALVTDKIKSCGRGSLRILIVNGETING